MNKLPSLQERLQDLPQSVPGTNQIMTIVGRITCITGISVSLDCLIDKNKIPIELYYICCGISILGLVISMIDSRIKANNISKFDDAFNNKIIYFQEQTR